MTAEHWARIKEIFGGALELPGEERLAFLKQSCGSDLSLREEVERLLDAERGPLENPILGAFARQLAVSSGGPPLLLRTFTAGR